MDNTEKVNQIFKEVKEYLDEFEQEHYLDGDFNSYYHVSHIPIADIKGELYLSGLAGTTKLKKYNIKVLISLEQCGLDEDDKDIIQMQYKIRDETDDISINKMKNILDEISNVIHDSLSNGLNVLVHCAAGVSRSSTAVLYYFMKYHYNKDKTPLLSSLIKVKNNRKFIYPNTGFLKILAEKSINL